MKVALKSLGLLIIFLVGCSQKDPSQKDPWILENSKIASATLSKWLRDAGASDCYYNDQSFDARSFSNRVSEVLSSAIDSDNFMKPSRFPICLRVLRTKATEMDKRIFKRRIKDRLERSCYYKYEFELLMFGTYNSWGHDRVYFVEDIGDAVNVVVTEVDKLNEWNYSGGSSQQFRPNRYCVNEVGDSVGIYKIWRSNIIDDVFRDCQSESFAEFLRSVSRGSAFIYWETGPGPLLCGRHIFDDKEFMDWIDRRYYTYAFKLIHATENELVFVWDYCSGDTIMSTLGWIGADIRGEGGKKVRAECRGR